MEESTMGHLISEVYQSQWLKPEDLQGRVATVLIREATVETLRGRDGAQREAVVLTFVGKQKRMALNATQARTIAVQLGDDIDEWAGRNIRIGPGKLQNGTQTIVVLKREEEQ
jgi:hypothetical protein